MDNVPISSLPKKKYLNWLDFCDLFACKRSKAMLLMHAVGVMYIGSRAFVPSDALEEHLRTHGGITITWPHRKRK